MAQNFYCRNHSEEDVKTKLKKVTCKNKLVFSMLC